MSDGEEESPFITEVNSKGKRKASVGVDEAAFDF